MITEMKNKRNPEKKLKNHARKTSKRRTEAAFTKSFASKSH